MFVVEHEGQQRSSAANRLRRLIHGWMAEHCRVLPEPERVLLFASKPGSAGPLRSSCWENVLSAVQEGGSEPMTGSGPEGQTQSTLRMVRVRPSQPIAEPVFYEGGPAAAYSDFQLVFGIT